MTAAKFSEDEQWVILFALRDRYRRLYDVRAICVQFLAKPPTYPGAPPPADYQRDIADYDAKLAEVERIVAKLPEPLCSGWFRLAAEARAEVDAERSVRAA